MVDFISGIFEFFLMIGSLVLMLIQSLLNFILSIPKYLTVAYTVIDILPNIIKFPILIGLPLMVIMVILGR